jgi:polysaccharide biosynthesis protein PslH
MLDPVFHSQRSEVPSVCPTKRDCAPRDILYLVHRVPYPPDKGDRIRAFHLLRSLSGRATVHLACLADEPVREETIAELRRYCERVAVVPLGTSRWVRAAGSLVRGQTITEGAFYSPALRDMLRTWAEQTRFHAALASSSAMVPYLRLEGLSGIPAVVDLVDVDSQKWFDYAGTVRGWRAWLYHTEGRRLRSLEQQLPSWARAVTLVSEPEANLYREFCRPGQVRAIRNGVDLDYFRPQDGPTEPSCVFVGALDYRPNVDAACWFCEEVWPLLYQRFEQARLWLVGRRPAPAVQRLARQPGVELVGQVPDVRPWMARAAVVVAPLRLARGLQNKVLEALAMSKAVVASPPALAALHVQPGVHLLSASSAAEWAEAVLHLLHEEPLRRQLGLAGRRYVEEHHHWDRCLEPFGELLGLTADPAGPPTPAAEETTGSICSSVQGS